MRCEDLFWICTIEGSSEQTWVEPVVVCNIKLIEVQVVSKCPRRLSVLSSREISSAHCQARQTCTNVFAPLKGQK
jgi:hypothetical protein